MVVGASPEITALEGHEGQKEHDVTSEGHCGRSKRSKGERSRNEAGKVGKGSFFFGFLFVCFCFVIHVIKLEPYPKSYE